MVTKNEGAEFARDKGMLFLEASAKNDVHIQRAFEELIHKILEVPTLVRAMLVMQRHLENQAREWTVTVRKAYEDLKRQYGFCVLEYPVECGCG